MTLYYRLWRSKKFHHISDHCGDTNIEKRLIQFSHHDKSHHDITTSSVEAFIYFFKFDQYPNLISLAAHAKKASVKFHIHPMFCGINHI